MLYVETKDPLGLPDDVVANLISDGGEFDWLQLHRTTAADVAKGDGAAAFKQVINGLGVEFVSKSIDRSERYLAKAMTEKDTNATRSNMSHLVPKSETDIRNLEATRFTPAGEHTILAEEVATLGAPVLLCSATYTLRSGRTTDPPPAVPHCIIGMKGRTIVGVIAGSVVQENGLPFVGCLEALASGEATQCVHFLNKSVKWCVLDVNGVLWVPMGSFVFYMTMDSKFS